MADTTIRPAFLAVLFKLESTEGVDEVPTGADAIPVEADSFTRNSPVAEQDSNEASGSYVAAAPLVVGQPATFGFRSRIKGAGAGVTYTALVRPPLHAALAACGKRGLFTAAIGSALATAGSTISATLGTGFSATAQAYRGMSVAFTAGTGTGELPVIIDYSAAKVATFADLLATAADATSSIAIPANWTYAGTSPKDLAARAADHPSATAYIYRDGRLLKFIGCRGTVEADGASAKPGFATFSFTGIYAGESDAAIPALTLASHSAPNVLQGTALTEAFTIDRKPLPIATFRLSDGASVESPDDPNTLAGFQAGIIGARKPVLTCDPLATLIATRDTLGAIAAGSVYPGVIRAGYTSGNRWAIVMPQLQPTAAADGTRGQLLSEQQTYRLTNPPLPDPTGRDGDWVLCFS